MQGFTTKSDGIWKILILDCCFSGRAIQFAMGTEDDLLRSNLSDIEGTYVLTSTRANQLAVAPIGKKYTAFTGELLRALKRGINNGKEEISLRELYEHLRTKFL